MPQFSQKSRKNNQRKKNKTNPRGLFQKYMKILEKPNKQSKAPKKSLQVKTNHLIIHVFYQVTTHFFEQTIAFYHIQTPNDFFFVQKERGPSASRQGGTTLRGFGRLPPGGTGLLGSTWGGSTLGVSVFFFPFIFFFFFFCGFLNHL